MSKIPNTMRELIVKAAYMAKHGHMPSALSIVEIMQSYHDIETQDDVMILSKGHGCLALYSLLVIQGHVDEKELLTFGKKGSKLGGHPDRNKIDKIYASTGSLGHGLPIAIGAGMAKKIMKKNGKVFCVIGDGEINEGSIWESILVAVNNKLDNLICIVDYNKSQVRSLEPKLTTQMFESFGCDVFEVDGHSIKALTDVMKYTPLNGDSFSEKPRVILANTIKGRGIKEIENDMFVGTTEHQMKKNTKDSVRKFMRAEFAKLCHEVVQSDSKSIVMVGDISHFLLRETEKEAPDRFYNIGICEQTMVGMASGMAIEGMKPIIHTIAPFLVERAYEQIKNDLGYQHTDVTIVTVGGTYDYSDLGCTHHCYGDIALMRLIPNMEVYEPGTPKELRDLFLQTWGNGNPKYFRLSAHTHSQDLNVSAGEVNIVRNSTNGKYVFVTGHLLDDVLESTQGHGVIYLSTLHEISKNSIEKIYSMFSTKDTFLFSVENHFKVGGLGDLISDTLNLPVTRIGLDTKFLTDYGSYEDLRKQGNIDKFSIYQKLRRI